MKGIKFYLIIVSVICSTIAISQNRQSELNRLLHGKTKLNEIIKTVSDYYTPKIITQNSSDQNFRRLRTWHRWALYMSNRLDADGNITDVAKRNGEALQQLGTGNRTDGTSSSIGTWGFIGPSAVNNPNINLGIGRCDRIAFHPTDPNILYVGTPCGGLWRSINDGASWICLTNNIPNQSVSGVVVDYTNPSVIYILTGAGDNAIENDGLTALGYIRSSSGVYKTTDGGTNWSLTGTLSNNVYSGFRLVQDPNDHNTLLAATTAGIYRTTNGGNSWTQVSQFKTFDIEYCPNNSGRVYASKHSGIIYSTNSGGTWNEATLSGGTLQDYGRFELAVSPNNPAYVYALGGNSNSDGTFSGLYKSTDYGVHFTEQSHTPNILSSTLAGNDDGSQGMYDLALAVSPTDATRIFTGGVNVWTSTNGGSTMTNIMFDANNARKIHPDFHEMKFSPLNGGLYAVNDGGVYKSTNNGVAWTKVSIGLAVGEVYHLTGIDADANILMAGLQDDGIKSRTTATNSFNQNATGDGFAVALRHNANTAGNDSGVFSLNTSVYRVSLNGSYGANPLSYYGEWFPSVAMYTTGASYTYAGFSRVHRSTNNGVTWVTKDGNGSWCMSTCPSNAQRVYAAGGDNWYANDHDGVLRRSDNAGDNWGTKFSSTNAAYNKITDIGVNPSNSAYVWITIGGFINGTKVFKSIDAGESWTNVSPGLPNVPVNCIAVDASNNAYIGTDIGVFFWSNSQGTWLPFYNGMPVVPVTDLVINASANVIRASTFGRGIYSSDLYSTCSSTLALNTTYAGNDFYEASSTISSTGSIIGGPDTHVFFKAGSSISFTEGFNVAEGNEFKAYLGACGIGMPNMKAVGQSISLPDYHFTLSSTIEVTGVSATGCDLKIECSKSANLKIVIADENNVVVKEEVITPSEKITIRTIAYNFIPGKMYKAILFEDAVPAHWQEIIR